MYANFGQPLSLENFKFSSCIHTQQKQLTKTTLTNLRQYIDARFSDDVDLLEKITCTRAFNIHNPVESQK